MNFDFDAFFAQVNRQFVLSEGQRYGQFMMNYLYEKFPEIVVPEEYDCFYDNKKVVKLIDYLASLKWKNQSIVKVAHIITLQVIQKVPIFEVENTTIGVLIMELLHQKQFPSACNKIIRTRTFTNHL